MTIRPMRVALDQMNATVSDFAGNGSGGRIPIAQVSTA